jgi:hypothetical protein
MQVRTQRLDLVVASELALEFVQNGVEFGGVRRDFLAQVEDEFAGRQVVVQPVEQRITRSSRGDEEGLPCAHVVHARCEQSNQDIMRSDIMRSVGHSAAFLKSGSLGSFDSSRISASGQVCCEITRSNGFGGFPRVDKVVFARSEGCHHQRR